MPITHVESSFFQTSDGAKFDAEENAQRHQKLIDAKSAYEVAMREYLKLLASTFKTKDGAEFRLSTLETYYFIVEPIYSMPRLSWVSFYIWQCEINIEADRTLIGQKDSETGDWKIYDPRELYRDEGKAKAALKICQREWLQERLGEIEASS